MQEENKKVLILGDSFATSLGCFSNNFLDHIKAEFAFNTAVTFYNPSVFNLTTADAYFLLLEYLEDDSYDAVVLGLGNCDCCAFGYYKKEVNSKPARKQYEANKKYDAKVKKANRILRRHPPFTYRPTGRSTAPATGAVSAKDFGRNIAKISGLCQKHEIPFILINIDANKYFPACNNAGNYCYAKIFGLESSLPYSGMGESPELNNALTFHDTGNFAAATATYNDILESTNETECKVIALNNLAAIAFAQENFDAAKDYLSQTEQYSSNHLYPVALYNAAIYSDAVGNKEEAARLFEEAFAKDYSSYRIQELYREAAKTNAGTEHVIDAKELLTKEDFVDYCHPTSTGHKKIGQALSSKLQEILNTQPGNAEMQIEYLPANPDHSIGFETDFFAHFGISVTPDTRIGFDLLNVTGSYEAALKQADNLTSDLKANVINTIKAHPLYGSTSYLKEIHPVYKSDQGRVPEFFFIRQILPALDRLNSNNEITGELEAYISDAGKIAQWWSTIRLPDTGNAVKNAERAGAATDWEEVAARLNTLIDYSVDKGVVHANRLRSITNWFMREALVFGAVSNTNMLFRRKHFWYIADSCAFYYAFAPNDNTAKELFKNIVSRANAILSVHNEFTPRLRPEQPEKALVAEYNEKLLKLKNNHAE